MKKLLTATGIVLVFMAACTNSSSNEKNTTDSTEIKLNEGKATEAQGRENEIKDSTKMLDKKLADSNSKYSPDSLK